ncbi:MAG: peptide deformylase [Bdellovibrionales bacterium]|nr:peptide deformylase [Bdellovibrionales bacterium]
MSIRKVARMGHPVLREKARDLTPEEIGSDEFERLLEDMVDTMEEYGGIGLAAPQIHESLSVAIIEYADDHPRYSEQTEKKDGADGETSMPLTVFINPKVTVLDPAEQGFWEGCLSVPELRGLVYRPRKIRVDYLDRDAKPRSVVAEGFLATVFQHELDHLSGTLFVDRIRYAPGESPISFVEEYARYHVPARDSDVGELAD